MENAPIGVLSRYSHSFKVLRGTCLRWVSEFRHPLFFYHTTRYEEKNPHLSNGFCHIPQFDFT
jgi:hypothetical protein